MTALTLLSLAWVTDPAPADKDVKAGWTAFAIFLLLIAAVVFLSFSLVKQLRKAKAAQEAGVYGDEVDSDQDNSHGSGHDSDTPATH